MSARFGSPEEYVFFTALSAVALLTAVYCCCRKKNSSVLDNILVFAVPPLILCTILADSLLVCPLMLAGCFCLLTHHFRNIHTGIFFFGAAAGVFCVSHSCENMLLWSTALVTILSIPVFFRTPGKRIAAAVWGIALFTAAVFGRDQIQQHVKMPRIPVKTAVRTDDRTLYNLTMFACAEYGAVPEQIRYIGGNPRRNELEDLSMSIFLQSSGGEMNIEAFRAGDFLRSDYLARLLQQEGLPGDMPEKKESAAGFRQQIIVHAPGVPADIAGYYWYTEECFRRMKQILPPDGVFALALPESFTPELQAAVLAAMRKVFGQVKIFRIPAPCLIASAKAELTDIPEELDRRAEESGIYETMLAPYGLFTLVFPSFREPAKDIFLSSLAEESGPFRAASLQQILPPENPLRKAAESLRYLFLGLLILYPVFRYWRSWKPENKQRFRFFESGFYFTGIILMGALFRFYLPNSSLPENFTKSLFCFLTAAAVATPSKAGIFTRILLPGAVLTVLMITPGLSFYLEYIPVIAAGFSVQYVLKQAKQTDSRNSPVLFFLGSALACIFFPVLFFQSCGLYLTAGLLLLMPFFQRKPAA